MTSKRYADPSKVNIQGYVRLHCPLRLHREYHIWLERDRNSVYLSQKIGCVTDELSSPDPSLFGFAQVKLYHTPVDAFSSLFVRLRRSLYQHHSRADLLDDHSVLLAEFLNPRDPRCSSQEMSGAKRKNSKGIIDQSAFKVIPKEGVPPGCRVLPSSCVLTIKSMEVVDVKFKAYYLVGWQSDKMEHMMVHKAQKL